jgi:hypothetical protein
LSFIAVSAAELLLWHDLGAKGLRIASVEKTTSPPKNEAANTLMIPVS